MRRQHELDRIAGGSAWGMLRPHREELETIIRMFFARAV
jgi:hypothetical protein